MAQGAATALYTERSEVGANFENNNIRYFISNPWAAGRPQPIIQAGIAYALRRALCFGWVGRLPYGGGNWNNRSNAGLFQFNANYLSDETNSNDGARHLVCTTTICVGSPPPLGENIAE